MATFDVFAGVFPEDKIHMVQALQGNGHVVGMTGDGVLYLIGEDFLKVRIFHRFHVRKMLSMLFMLWGSCRRKFPMLLNF